MLRRELAGREHTIADLEQRLGNAAARLQAAAAGGGGLALGGLNGLEPAAGLAGAGSMPAPQVTLGLAGAGSMPLPTTLPIPSLVSLQQQQQQPQQLVVATAPVAAALAPQMAPLAAPVADAGMAAQQVQVLGMQPSGQVVMSLAPAGGVAPAVQQVLLPAQPAGTTLSGGALAAAAAAAGPALTAMSEGLSGEAAAAAGMQQMRANAAPTTTGLSGPGGESGAGCVADAAAQNLNQQAQHLTVQASMHGHAKTAATSQAQQLASQAQMHAQASVQAAVQAEQLKQTLAGARCCWVGGPGLAGSVPAGLHRDCRAPRKHPAFFTPPRLTCAPAPARPSATLALPQCCLTTSRRTRRWPRCRTSRSAPRRTQTSPRRWAGPLRPAGLLGLRGTAHACSRCSVLRPWPATGCARACRRPGCAAISLPAA